MLHGMVEIGPNDDVVVTRQLSSVIGAYFLYSLASIP